MAYKTGEFEGIRVEQAVQQVSWESFNAAIPALQNFMPL